MHCDLPRLQFAAIRCVMHFTQNASISSSLSQAERRVKVLSARNTCSRAPFVYACVSVCVHEYWFNAFSCALHSRALHAIFKSRRPAPRGRGRKEARGCTARPSFNCASICQGQSVRLGTMPIIARQHNAVFVPGTHFPHTRGHARFK